MSENDPHRREFLKTAGMAGLALNAASAFGKSAAKSSGRVIGANDRINVGVIGYGGRGEYVAGQFARYG